MGFDMPQTPLLIACHISSGNLHSILFTPKQALLETWSFSSEIDLEMMDVP